MNTVQVISSILQSWFSLFSLNVEFCYYFWYTLTYWVRQNILGCLDNFTFWFGSVFYFSALCHSCLVKKAITYWYKSKANFSDIIESVGLSTCCRMTSKLVWAIYRQSFSILTNPPLTARGEMRWRWQAAQSYCSELWSDRTEVLGSVVGTTILVGYRPIEQWQIEWWESENQRVDRNGHI